MKRSIISIFLCATLLTSVIAVGSAKAGNIIGSAILGIGIGIIVDTYGNKIDTFLNDLLKKNKLDTKAATKVVSIISIGDGSAIGAAQITGDKSKVDKVKAVLQLESNKTFGSPLRMRLLIPVDKKSIKDVTRIDGVGVSTLIDIKL